jgi:hypothetical protein
VTLLGSGAEEDGALRRPGNGLGDGGGDPYNTDAMRQRLRQEQEMFDKLLGLKEKLEMELPFMFVEDLDSSHFATDVVFKEPHLPPIRGRANYQRFLRSLRDTGRLLFEDPTFKVVRATQHAEDGLVKVRWKISGNYQSPLKFFHGPFGCFDGISYYYVKASTGLVSVHQVDYQTPIMPLSKSLDALSWSTAWAGLVPHPAAPACKNDLD